MERRNETEEHLVEYTDEEVLAREWWFELYWELRDSIRIGMFGAANRPLTTEEILKVYRKRL